MPAPRSTACRDWLLLAAREKAERDRTPFDAKAVGANVIEITAASKGERFRIAVTRREIPVVKPAPPAQGKLLETPESVIGAYGRERK